MLGGLQRSDLLIVAGTIANAGLGFKPTYRGNAVPGRLHLVATGLGPAELARNAVRCLLGRRLKGRPHYDLLAAEVRIRFARPQTYTFDGDLFREHRRRLRFDLGAGEETGRHDHKKYPRRCTYSHPGGHPHGGVLLV